MTVDELLVDNVTSEVAEIDWNEYRHTEYGTHKDEPHGPSWEAYEANYCEKCKSVIVLGVGMGDGLHADLDPDAVLPPCTISSHHGDAGPCDECTESTGEEGVGICTCEDARCDGHVPIFEGPRMNYFYPCKLRDTQEAAKKIAHLPLCVVEFSDGRTGFALTGGGMDLSWEICGAYIACGYLPPAEMSLPYMGSFKLEGWRLRTYEAMIRSQEVRIRWSENALYHLKNLKQQIEDHNARQSR